MNPFNNLWRIRWAVAFLFALATFSASADTGASSGGASKGGAPLSFAGAGAGGAGAVPIAQAGFGCAAGSWGIQNGALTCVVAPPLAVTSITSHWGFINVLSASGWTSSPAVQIVGEANDIRVDALTQGGSIIASCYLSMAGAPCDVAGLSGSANSTYQSYKQLPNAAGSLYDAAALIANNGGLGGSNSGSNGADNYVITASIDASNNITVKVVGYFTYSATSTTSKLAPIFATFTIAASSFAANPNGHVYTASGVCQAAC